MPTTMPALEARGRELLCLGPDLRIVHVSAGLEPDLVGLPAEEVLGPELLGEQGPLRRALVDPRVSIVVLLRPAEEPSLRAALEAHRWRREETARALGISRTTLWRRMRELGLTEPRDFRENSVRQEERP